MKHIKTFNQLNEGTWSFPNTPSKANELKDLLKKPITVKYASDILYNVFGDDALFDEFYDIEKKFGDEEDVRIYVKDYLKKYIKQHEEDPSFFRNPISDETIEILKSI